MDKQKVTNKFPLVEAILLMPKEGQNGQIAVCTNTSSPGEVVNEISEENRKNICVLGSSIVSRDGVERMVINSLAHPTLKYLILFSEESLTFAPSTNLLQAVMEGFDPKRNGNFIKGGVAASPHYPNLNDDILEAFRNQIIILPIFIKANKGSKDIILNYTEYIKPKISDEIYTLLKNSAGKDKIYYDSLNKLIELVGKIPFKEKGYVYLDPKQFQQLQPPKVQLNGVEKKTACPFSVKIEKGNIRLDIKISNKDYFIKSSNGFLLSYSLMKFLGEKKSELSPLQQLLLGAEIGRVAVELINKVSFHSFIIPAKITGTKEIPLESSLQLKIDKKYYYRVRTQGKKISVLCMAFDVCAEFFELLSVKPLLIFDWLVNAGRFDNYEMDILHRIDIGIQVSTAGIASSLNYSFIQDFSTIFKINKKILPLLIADSDNFLDVHRNVLRQIYTGGITEEHGDAQKGLARTASVMAIFRNAKKALNRMPRIYQQSTEDTAMMREEYKKQLLRKDHDGTYTYGERTRTYFGFDQLEHSIKVLKKDPTRATVVQRFDPTKDMTSYVDPVSGKTKFTHDPCLTHDIYLIQNKKLHSFHLARAHNAVNAYPENIFGLYDAYVSKVRDELKLKSGDMYMLSNRANILLITEEQRTKKILAEPSKPADEIDNASGLYLLGDKIKSPAINAGGVAYFSVKAKKVTKKPSSKILKRLENYEGQNIVNKAIDYLKLRGVMHNNPLLTEYYAKNKNSQDDQLAFFQANGFGGKIYGTAVFTNRSLLNKKSDLELCNYLLTKYSSKLKLPLGDITIVYINFNNN